jgi:hypothetical protein
LWSIDLDSLGTMEKPTRNVLPQALGDVLIRICVLMRPSGKHILCILKFVSISLLEF